MDISVEQGSRGDPIEGACQYANTTNRLAWCRSDGLTMGLTIFFIERLVIRYTGVRNTSVG